MEHLTRALAALDSKDSRRREFAADTLADYLAGTGLTQVDAELLVSRLVAVAVNEVDNAVRESALNSVCEAFNGRALPLRLFETLIPGLAGMHPDLLEYALYILGSTRDPAAADTIRRFVQHPHPAVRASAAFALEYRMCSADLADRLRYGVHAMPPNGQGPRSLQAT